MGRPRLWTPAKHAALMASQTAPPSPAPLPNYVPVTDRTPMGYARRDAEQTALHLSGEIAELQRRAAALSTDADADADAERIADALQRIITSAATALAHAGRLRGIRETIANFEETP